MKDDDDTEDKDPMYDMERRTRMVELSNKLSLADLAVLIDINAERITILPSRDRSTISRIWTRPSSLSLPGARTSDERRGWASSMTA